MTKRNLFILLAALTIFVIFGGYYSTMEITGHSVSEGSGCPISGNADSTTRLISHTHINTTHAYTGDEIYAHVHINSKQAYTLDHVHSHIHINATHARDNHDGHKHSDESAKAFGMTIC